MSDETVVETPVESGATPERQAEATKLGWMPPERYKGDPERFVDAEEFITRGETVLPIVKKQLESTRAELAQERAARQRTDEALATAQKAIEQIEVRHSVATQKAVERARTELKEQLVLASRDGDHIGVAELTDQLTKLNAAEEAPPAQKPAVQAPWQPSPEMLAWNAQNAWYGTDTIKTSLANGFAQKLRQDGNQDVGVVFLNRVAAAVEAYGREEATPADKVSGSRNGSDGEAPRGNGSRKNYNHLPADAKAQCDSDARQFVGPNKAYKTQADWRSAFANLYFSE